MSTTTTATINNTIHFSSAETDSSSPAAVATQPGASRGHQLPTKEPAPASPSLAAAADQHGAAAGDQIFESFDSMGLKEDLLRGIYAHGFEKPSEIQKRGIVVMASGRDIVGQAQSGTGKTGCFTIGALERVDPSNSAVQCIMLSNTRELANQTHKVCQSLGDRLGVSAHPFVGGTRMGDDCNVLRAGKAQIAIGTPGRVLHLIRAGALFTDQVKVFVLDEADEMLDGFMEPLYEIIKVLPKQAQIALFSATLPPAALEISTKFMQNPVSILVEKEKLTLAGINQYYVNVEKEEWKLDTLCDLYSVISIAQTMIFCANRRKADWLARSLDERGHTVSLIHGELDPKERELRMAEFRTGASRMLISERRQQQPLFAKLRFLMMQLPAPPPPCLTRRLPSQAPTCSAAGSTSSRSERPFCPCHSSTFHCPCSLPANTCRPWRRSG